MRVGKALGLDVPGIVEVALDEALAPSERGNSLAHGGIEQLGDLLDGAGDLEAATAAPEGSLDRNREPVLLGEGDDLIGTVHRVGCSWHLRGTGLLGDVASRHLVAERPDRRGRRPDPGEPGVDHGLGEVGILGEEAVPGMDGIGA